MHYDFIEIGTSDFETLIEEASDTTTGLSIEPLKVYLDNLPDKSCVKKVNAAIGKEDGELDIYYIHPDDVEKYALPWWVKGSNSIGHPHKFTKQQLGEKVYNKLARIEKVPVLSWDTLISQYNITSIGYLKTDTEGFDHIIINSLMDKCDENPELLPEKIRMEAREGVSDMQATERLLKRFHQYSLERNEGDVILTKRKHKKAYVLYCTLSYLDTVRGCVESLRAVSNLPIYVYQLDFYEPIEGAVAISWLCLVDIVEQRDFIERTDERLYKIMIQRPAIVKDCLEKYAETVAYIDSDSVATKYADNIFDYFPVNAQFPYFVEGILDYMLLDGRGGAESKDDLSTTLEAPACDLFNVNQQVREKYRQTGYFVAGQNCMDFLEEWNFMCNHPVIINSPNRYAPFHEETIANVLLWKYNIQTGLPYLYVNGKPGETGEPPWYKVPEGNILFYHNEKKLEKMREMIKSLKKVKILYLAPHLSTGGMPQFLLKRIEMLVNDPEFEISVIEYNNYGDEFVVQKNKIRKLVRDYNTLDENKSELINLIRNNPPDIIHLDETAEWYNMPDDVVNFLYSPERKWKIVETCHNVGEGHNRKTHFPDAFLFCTPYHLSTFPNKGIREVITYPVDRKIVTKEEYIKAKLALDFSGINIINIGLWTPGKNQQEMIEEARRYPQFNFHFIGNLAGNFRDYWEPLVKELPDNVTVWGERNDVETFMKAADVFMFNSTNECNPIVLREAISYELPIVARNLPQYMNMFGDILQNNLSTIEYLRTIYCDLSNFETSETFRDKHKSFYIKMLAKPVQKPVINTGVEIIQHFVDGPYVEIKGNTDDLFTIRIYDENDSPHYQNTITSNAWIRVHRKWYTQWKTKIWRNGEIMYEDIFSLKGRKVFISFESSAIGDSIAWMPYVEEFRKKHQCEMVLSTHKNFLFKKAYPEITFVEPGTTVHGLYAMYRIGWFYDNTKEPVLPNTISLQQCATNILGLEYKEIIPKIVHDVKPRQYKEKYVTIASNSTMGCKFWIKEHWQEVINHLVSRDYKVINVSKERNDFKNCFQITDTSLENTMNVIHHSEFFIGLSSGLSWLAWALGKHVYMISNFTNKEHEFQSNCTRIVNENVCHACWNEPDTAFSKSNWNWCKYHEGTERQWECHTSITPEMVIDKMKERI